MKTETFFRRVMLEAGRPDLEDARRLTAVVFHALRDRLTRDEANQVAAQLPAELKTLWRTGEVAWREPLKMDRDEFYARVRAEAELASDREARAVTRAVFAALQDQLSPGETDDVLAQLPRDLKAVWKGV
jgi:uncharacterized protein (DUF2267 family)